LLKTKFLLGKWTKWLNFYAQLVILANRQSSVFGSILNRNFGRNRKMEWYRNRNRNAYRNRNFGRNRYRNRKNPITKRNTENVLFSESTFRRGWPSVTWRLTLRTPATPTPLRSPTTNRTSKSPSSTTITASTSGMSETLKRYLQYTYQLYIHYLNEYIWGWEI
jgi:hypothetical protein